jgi:hypothetical protein
MEAAEKRLRTPMGFDFDRETRRRLGVMGRLDNLRGERSIGPSLGKGPTFRGRRPTGFAPDAAEYER